MMNDKETRAFMFEVRAEENEENELVAEGGKVTLQSLVFYDYGEKSAALI